jgi:hypothetical protein
MSYAGCYLCQARMTRNLEKFYILLRNNSFQLFAALAEPVYFLIKIFIENIDA